MIDPILPFILIEFAQRAFEIESISLPCLRIQSKEFYPIFPQASELVYLYCTNSVSQIPHQKSKKIRQLFRWRPLTSTAQPAADGSRPVQLKDVILTTSAVTGQLLMKPLG